ncbi:MAG: class I SAM-dependent methyltransferase [Gemmatimonadota bacterium]|nr:class I SAM-dependent methyltransferase [Gemmatimonadota bacterium]
MTQLQSRLRRQITRVGLLPAAFFLWRTLRTWTPSTIRNNRAARRNSALPVPPDSLIFSSTATRDVEWFLRSGEQFAGALRNALVEAGRPIESFSRILDFGCGSGRVVRQWAAVKGPAFFGCDYNPRSVAWDKQNLTYARFGQNSLEPPLPYESGVFDLCYSVSVFTHLSASLQRPWIAELHRVIAPGGLLVLTLSGRGDFGRLTEVERSRFEEGELIVVDAELAGTNMCAVFHPLAYVRREWSDLFSLVRHYPSGAKGSPNQDLYVFERVSAGSK